ncbi:large ribosomal subunit protein mL48 [Antennarius striatus]|uniref:large ribosomal subunit protein mL48 n=1 Tax=Antennarius striatus TaxID=241820 RepID=UPI0035B19124
MNSVIRKLQVSAMQQAATLRRAPSCIRLPVWASMNERQYRSKPTHGIGKWKHLLPKVEPKKSRDRHQIKPIPIVEATDTAYGTLNFKVSGYDMTLVEHYSQYIHKVCNQLDIKVADSYALQTKTTELYLMMPDKGKKMLVDSVIKTHERVIQVKSLNTLLCPVFMEVLLKNQPEGVRLSVIEHTDAEFKARFKQRPDLEDLRTQVGRQ